jgi:hypothetical protein
MQTEIHIVLNSWFTCTLAFLERFKKEMLFIAPGVPRDVLFTVELLGGAEYWASLSDWEKTLAGMCMVYLVEHGHVPFEYVPRTGRNPYPLQYRIKGSYIHH